MSTLRFYKLVGQIVCVEVDGDGDVIGERAIAEMQAFGKHLPDLPALVADAVEQANAQAPSKNETSATG